MNCGDIDPDNAFWRFSCAVYAAPGVASACLGLQDGAGADVNLLLLAAWLGAARGRRLVAADLAALPGAGWEAEVIGPLRAARRAVPRDDPTLAAFRAQILACELAAERIRQAVLFRWAETRFPPDAPAVGLAHANLAALVRDTPGAAAALGRLAQTAEAVAAVVLATDG